MRIVLKKPPIDVVFGLQKGSGSVIEVEQVQIAKGGELLFDFMVEIKGTQQNDELPDFKGPFVQGPKFGRFIYINIGTYSGHAQSPVGGRMKIPLTGITWEILRKANIDTGLQTHVAGTGKNGGPNYATVKPFEGWSIMTRE